MVNITALYYYGDIDMTDYAFKYGWQSQNLTLGGSAMFGYLHPMGNHCNWRFALSGGFLQGNDSARYEKNKEGEMVQMGKGRYRTGFLEPSVGIEWYPFSKAGFYLYAGVAVNMNYVQYDFTRVNRGSGEMFCLLPMIPIEIGYNFAITKGWFISVTASVHQGLLDVGHANLDAWPIVKSSRFQWPDGYFQLGVGASYRWNRCEKCRKKG